MHMTNTLPVLKDEKSPLVKESIQLSDLDLVDRVSMCDTALSALSHQCKAVDGVPNGFRIVVRGEIIYCAAESPDECAAWINIILAKVIYTRLLYLPA